MQEKNRRLIGFITFIVAYAILSLAVLWGCSPKTPSSDLLQGAWQSKNRNVYTILSFRANGTWGVNLRIEGRLAKIIKKKGDVSGVWEFSEGHLTMTAKKNSLNLVWDIDQPLSYEVLELTKSTLRLKPSSGQEQIWTRVRSGSQANGSRTGSLKLDPFIVNLSKSNPQEKGRYVCAYIELTLASLDLETDLHPEVREKIIFFLSALTYQDVNTFKKIAQIKDELKRVLTPYIEGGISELGFKNIVIASDNNTVEKFLAACTESEKKAANRKNEDDNG